MPTPITQELGFDVVKAINNLNQLNGSISSFNRRINSLANNLGNFNRSGQTAGNTMNQVAARSRHLDAGVPLKSSDSTKSLPGSLPVL